MKDITLNKQAFLTKKPKKLFLVSLVGLFLFIILFIILYCNKMYDHYVTKGYVDCSEECKVIVVVPTNIDIQKIKINNKDWKYKILTKTLEIDQQQVVSYYIYTFASDSNFQDKEIIEFNFCYNKQRILKKFIKKIF